VPRAALPADVVGTPTAVSSDARSGLAWVPYLQALAAWDNAERAWRATDTDTDNRNLE